jgi:hypothetical protein
LGIGAAGGKQAPQIRNRGKEGKEGRGGEGGICGEKSGDKKRTEFLFFAFIPCLYIFLPYELGPFFKYIEA